MRTAPIGAIQGLYRLIRIFAASDPLKVTHQILSKPVAKVGNDQSNNDQCGNCNDLYPMVRLLITRYDIVFHIFLHGFQNSMRHEGTQAKLNYIKLSRPRVARPGLQANLSSPEQRDFCRAGMSALPQSGLSEPTNFEIGMLQPGAGPFKCRHSQDRPN